MQEAIPLNVCSFLLFVLNFDFWEQYFILANYRPAVYWTSSFSPRFLKVAATQLSDFLHNNISFDVFFEPGDAL